MCGKVGDDTNGDFGFSSVFVSCEYLVTFLLAANRNRYGMSITQEGIKNVAGNKAIATREEDANHFSDT